MGDAVRIDDRVGIREALQHQAIEPFAMRLADGRALPVRQAERVAVGRRRIIVVQGDDSRAVVEPLVVVSFDSNGSKTAPE